MSAREELLDDLAGAILDGRPIDWASAELSAGEREHSLLDQLRFLSALADVHRRSLANSFEESDEGPTADLQGEVIGAYRLVELLGRGGMGEVYLGERADGRFEQKVAVKLVRRGMDSLEILRRFARERRILARLEHPRIARLLDGGETAGGRPYFVMELVQGEPMTKYCKSRGVLLEDRLRLFVSCCEAVDAAHRALVVHRDLKPSNILVTPEGHVKLLDFGIAKLLEEDGDVQLTLQDGRVITPGYAAPEQIVGGAITVATDVFALGVVLYELVTGVLPHDRRSTSPHELALHVERETAERPSIAAGRSPESQRWVRRVRGDLDTIIMKAIAHEPDRRYSSAAALAEDLRRYLTSRPVEARPDSLSYRLRKFVMRNRLVVAASGLVAAAVLVALAVSLYQTGTARLEAERASREAERAAAAQTFLASIFEQIDPDRYVGSAPTVRDLLERASERVDRELGGQPELRADMQALLGQVFDQLSVPKQGETHWRRAVETRQALFGSNDARTAKAKKGLAISLARQGRFAESEPLFRELLEHEQVRRDRREMGSVLLNYGNQKRLLRDFATAEQFLERSVALLENAGADASKPLGSALHNLGLLYRQQDRSRDAVKPLERALAIRMKIHGPDSSAVAYAKKTLSHLHRDLKELDIAEQYGQEALVVAERVFPPNHPFIGTTLESLGQIAERRGDRAKARAFYERSIKSYEGSDPPNDPGLAYPARFLAGMLVEDGKADEAVPLYERALSVRRNAHGETHPDVAESWLDLACGRMAVNHLNAALDAARKGVSILRSAPRADSSQLARGLFLVGDILRRRGHPEEARACLEEAQAIWRKKPPKNPKDLADLEAALAATRLSGSRL